MYYDSYNHNILGSNPSDYSLTFDQSNSSSLISLNDVNNARNNFGIPIGYFDNNVDSSFDNVNQQSMEGVNNQFMIGQTYTDNDIYPQLYSSANQLEICESVFPSNNFSNLVEEHNNLLFDHSVIGDGSSSNQVNQKIVLKRPWTAEADQKLIDLVNLHGEDWSHIAQTFSFRTAKQCRERWYNHLRPGIKKDPWSEEEDRVLIEAHVELGNKWSTIATHLPGRTENSIKNRWNANKRKWSNNNVRRRRCRTSGSSLLQNYMQSLAQFPAADESENMPDAVQQISYGDQGACSSSNLSNSAIEVGINWSGAMFSSFMMSENGKREMDLPETTALNNSFIF